MTGEPGAAAQGTPVPALGPLGPVTVLGAHILDVLGRPVEAIPPGQGSARLTEIRATAAGTAAGPGVDLAKLGASVFAVGAIGDDLLGDMVIADRAEGPDTGAELRQVNRRAGGRARRGGADLGQPGAALARRYRLDRPSEHIEDVDSDGRDVHCCCPDRARRSP